MDLGIFYILAVSSLSTYGILLAGFTYFFFFNKASHTNYAQEPKRSFSILVSVNSNSYPSHYFNTSSSFRILDLPVRSLLGRCFIHTTRLLSSMGDNNSNNSNNKVEYIQYPLRGGIAPLIPF